MSDFPERSQQEVTVRCIVCVCGERNRHHDHVELIRQLIADRGWQAEFHDDPCFAFAALCLLERSQASRTAWGLQRAERIGFAIAAPPCLLDAAGSHAATTEEQIPAQLIHAIDHHLPSVEIYHIADERLAPIDPSRLTATARSDDQSQNSDVVSRSDVAQADTEDEARMREPNGRAAPFEHDLRDDDGEGDDSYPAEESDPSTEPRGTQITSEELAMLFGDELRQESVPR